MTASFRAESASASTVLLAFLVGLAGLGACGAPEPPVAAPRSAIGDKPAPAFATDAGLEKPTATPPLETPAEAAERKAWRELEAYVEANAHFADNSNCAYATGMAIIGKSGAEAKSACRDAFAECKAAADAEAAKTPPKPVDFSPMQRALASCGLHAADAKRCVVDGLTPFLSITAETSCAVPGKPRGPLPGQTPPEPASCVELKKCKPMKDLQAK